MHPDTTGRKRSRLQLQYTPFGYCSFCSNIDCNDSADNYAEFRYKMLPRIGILTCRAWFQTSLIHDLIMISTCTFVISIVILFSSLEICWSLNIVQFLRMFMKTEKQGQLFSISSQYSRSVGSLHQVLKYDNKKLLMMDPTQWYDHKKMEPKRWRNLQLHAAVLDEALSGYARYKITTPLKFLSYF